MKDIVIIANFCRDFSETDNGRFMYLCKELSKHHKVEIITSDFSHGSKKPKEPLVHHWPFTITFLHETGYKKNISIQRFASHRVWGNEVKKYLEKREKPDVIYCAVPSLMGPLVAAKYCEKNNVKFIIDIQDLWPEAFKMVLNMPVISDLIFAPFNWLANAIYKRADEVVAVSDTYVERALSVNKKCTSGHTVYLGTKLETYDAGASGVPLHKKPEGEVWIGYCGSLAASYDIPTLVHATKKLYDKEMRNTRLIIMGDGAHRGQFETVVRETGVNAIFTGRLPYDQMCAQLSECDIVVNPIKKGSAASIINKHGDYAASGLPVVNSQDSQEYRDLVEQYQMGLNCNNEDANDMAEKLEKLILDEALRGEMGKNARRCAEERFDRKNSYCEIIDCILSE